jgi:hypothetical protein
MFMREYSWGDILQDQNILKPEEKSVEIFEKPKCARSQALGLIKRDI